MRILQIFTLVVILLLVVGTEILAETRVVTYVVKTQEERQSTRWTLTEWLRIKERMKMMDVWLAMFSSPKQDRFSPELQLSYGSLAGEPVLSSGENQVRGERLASSQARVDFWLTNLFTGMTGVRMLNIDLGIVGKARGINSYSARIASPEGKAKLAGFARASYGIGLRVFGKNVQDSSLTLGYGNYEWVPRAWVRGDDQVLDGRLAGNQANVALRLYLTKVLGLEGSATQYFAPSVSDGADRWSGQYADYGAFVEVSLLKLFAGAYQEQWQLQQDSVGVDYQVRESGYQGGVAISL